MTCFKNVLEFKLTDRQEFVLRYGHKIVKINGRWQILPSLDLDDIFTRSCVAHSTVPPKTEVSRQKITLDLKGPKGEFVVSSVKVAL